CNRWYDNKSFLNNIWHKDGDCLWKINRISLCLAHLRHFELEFNESPHLMVGRIMKLLQKDLSGYTYLETWRN
ncbi:hypothetical protein LCGC14_2692600, partial [marine sediment metagenome]